MSEEAGGSDKFEHTCRSIAGAPDILFVFNDGESGVARAELAGARMLAEHVVGSGAELTITDSGGALSIDIIVRPAPSDKGSVTDAVMRVGSALLWSHWRWVQAGGDEAVARMKAGE